MSVPGPTRTSQHVRFFVARGGEADISRRMQTDTIYKYAPYADEYTLFDCLDRLLQKCEDYGLQMTAGHDANGSASGPHSTRRSGRWAARSS